MFKNTWIWNGKHYEFWDDDNKTIRIVARFRNGLPVGLWKHYLEDGRINLMQYFVE